MNRLHGWLRYRTTYCTWASMKTRCLNPHADRYADYGGRGIGIHPTWLKFAGFLASMGERPDGLHLDRIDNDGNYEPGNCRWATRSEQQNNKRNNILVTWAGKTKTVAVWARENGVSRRTLANRVRRNWPMNVALNGETRAKTVKK